MDSSRSEIQPELSEEPVFQPLHVPLVGVQLFAGKLIERAAQNAADVVLQNQLPLIYALEQPPAQSVHGLALLVHHIVVLEQVLARLEVLPLYGLLRTLDA